MKNLLYPLGPHETWKIFPPGVWLMIVLAAMVAFILRYTQFGRHVYAIGSNEQTARLCGVNVELTKLLVYLIGVGLAGAAGVPGVFVSSRRGFDDRAGDGIEDHRRAVVNGGTSFGAGAREIFWARFGWAHC